MGGVPVWVPLPMLGQFLVEPEPDDVPDEPEPVLPEPELPVLELEDGVVVDEFELGELELEPVPELPVVVEVVAALATNAPPARRPELSAPMASTFRRRICMVDCPFVSFEAPTHPGRYRTRCAADLSAGAQRRRRVRRFTRRFDDNSQERGSGDEGQATASSR